MYQVHFKYFYQNCGVALISKSTQHCTTLVKINVLDTYGAICLYFGVVFLLLFKNTENAVYTSFKNSNLLFINGLIFGIMNIQNYQSLELE